MSSQFKNRLVGITILVALVVIFLPALIDGKKDAYQQEFVATPIKPEANSHTQQYSANEQQQSLTKEPVIISDNTAKVIEQKENGQWHVEEVAAPVTVGDTKKQPAQTIKHASSNTIKPKATKIVQDARNKPAWTIQLGAFQNKANIISLMKKLNKAGFQVHSVPRDVIDGQLTRVFVGPNVSKDKLEGQLPRLKRLTNLKGKIVPFNPIKP